MKTAWISTTRFILAAVLLAVVCQGCSPQAQADSTAKTLVAMRAAAIQAATAAPQKDTGANSVVATAQQEATETSQAIFATQTVLANFHLATETAGPLKDATIIAELPRYGLDESGGSTGWVDDTPLTLDITGYNQFAYGNNHQEVIAADFALAADMTWNTQYGSSGCGFMFRSDGNKNKPNQYMVIATRFGNGHVIFTALADGEIANIHDFYPKSEDRSFQSDNDTTNRLAVIARGNIIEIYTNGVKIGQVDTTKEPEQLPAPPKPVPPADQTNTDAMNVYKNQMKEYQDIVQQSQQSYQLAVKNYMNRPAVFNNGFLGMIAATESGRTVCKFNKAWLWLLNQ